MPKYSVYSSFKTEILEILASANYAGFPLEGHKYV